MNDTQRVFARLLGQINSGPGTDVSGALRQMVARRSVRVIKAAADSMASDATTEYVIARFPVATKVVSAHFTGASGGIAAHASNTATLTVSKRDGAGGSATPIAAYTSNTAGGDVTQWVPKALTVTEADSVVPAGGILTFKIAKASSGVVVPAGEIEVVVDELVYA